MWVFVAGAGLDEHAVVNSLRAAAEKCGLAEDDGEQSVLATMLSAVKVGWTTRGRCRRRASATSSRP